MLDPEVILHIYASTYECTRPSVYLPPLCQMPSSLSAFAFAHWDAFFYLCACLHPPRSIFPCVYLPPPIQVHLSTCVFAFMHPGASLHVCTCLHKLRWFTSSLYLSTHCALCLCICFQFVNLNILCLTLFKASWIQ